MIILILALIAGIGTGTGLYLGDVSGYGWSIFFGILAFGVVQGVSGWFVRRKVKTEMDAVQRILTEGQKAMQAKTARWQMRPPGSIKEAQMELERDTRRFVAEALAITDGMHRFDLWVPLMKRQIATAQFQLNWMIKDFRKTDALMDKAFFMDPMTFSMKMARMQMLDEPIEKIGKVYEKAVKRARYNQNVIPAATWSWILLKRGDAEGAFKALNVALEKSDSPVLKANRECLANNRPAHFSNSGLGDQWYSLHLEEPKVHQQRQRMQWR